MRVGVQLRQKFRAQWFSSKFLTEILKNKEQIKLTITSGNCYSNYKANVGWFSDDYKITQRKFQSNEACKKWCDEYPNCLAVAVSPSSWAYRECFLVSTSDVTGRSGWTAAITKACPSESIR
jgi:hypothetical protein